MKNKIILIMCIMIIILCSFVMATNFSITGVSYFDFNNNKIDQWSGYNMLNTLTYNASNFPIYNESFNGSTHSVTWDNSDVIKFFFAPEVYRSVFMSYNYSITTWVYKHENDSFQYDTIFSFTKNGGYLNQFHILNDNTLRARVNGTLLTTTTKILNLTWTHIALTFDNSTGNGTLYINGKKEIEGEFQNFKDNIGTNWEIGSETEATANTVFQGHIDDFKIFNVTLTDEQVKDEYNTGSKKSNPFITLNNPLNGAINISLNTTLNLTIDDLDGDDLNISIYWLNKSLIYQELETTNTSFLINVSLDEYNNTYFWFVNVTDGINYINTSILNFTTEFLFVNVTINETTTINKALNTNIRTVTQLLILFAILFVVLSITGIVTKNNIIKITGMGMGLMAGVILTTVNIPLGFAMMTIFAMGVIALFINPTTE